MNSETGIYTTFEESRNDIINQAKEFNWDLERLESENKLRINSTSSDNLKDIIEKIKMEKEAIDASISNMLSMIFDYLSSLFRF